MANARKEFQDTQKLVKDAAKNARKAADRAAKVAMRTGDKISKSKEIKIAKHEGRLALKAMMAALKVALDIASEGAKSLKDIKEVKRAGTKSAAAARSGVKATKTASSAAVKTATKKAKNVAARARKS